MRSIAIILGDNDFGNTFRYLLGTIAGVLRYREDLTKEDIVRLIAEGIPFHYLAFQAMPGQTDDAAARITRYLGKIKILFDEDADQAYFSERHDHGAWHLDTGSGQVNSF